MKVNGKKYRSIWVKEDDPKTICIIDQRQLPHFFIVEEIKTLDEMLIAIKDMHLRGAGLIGVAAAYGVYLAIMESKNENEIQSNAQRIIATRPTAVNLKWAVDRQLKAISNTKDLKEKARIAFETAGIIADEDADSSKNIGVHGLKLIEEISKRKRGEVVNILTHCNAGWLAFVDYGTATAPIYAAFEKGINIHVWVDETRPRNQGSMLTAWELGMQGVPCTVIADNTGGHLMQHGMVDLVIVGSDRTTLNGDVANKIGTYLKALAASDNQIPFYAALPSSTIDWDLTDGVKNIPIELRDEDELKYITGLANNEITKVLITPENAKLVNYSFDVTPARLVTGLITERGICKANQESILALFPEKRKL